MSRLPKKKTRPRSPSHASHGLTEELGRVQHLLQVEKDAPAARPLLEALALRHPGRVEVLILLAEAYRQLDLPDRTSGAFERLRKMMPDNPLFGLMLGFGYLSGRRMAHGRRILREMRVARPDMGDQITDALAKLEPLLDQLVARHGLDLADVELHERAQLLLGRGEFAAGRRAAEELIARRPDYLPGHLTLARIHAATGRFDEGLATVRQVLSRAPEDLFAHALLVRLLYMMGRPAEAAAMAGPIQALAARDSDEQTAKAEALSTLGEHRAVREVAAQAESPSPSLLHYDAVAALRLGDEKAALEGFTKALEKGPQAEARQNLQDLSRPPGERHGGWAFPLQHFLPDETLKELLRVAPRQTGPTAAVRNAIRGLLRRRPELAELVPVLLDRGDPEACDWAVVMAALMGTPPLLSALSDFAVGRRGADTLRQEAAEVVVQQGLRPPGIMHIWLDGQWQSVLVLAVEVYFEPVLRHPPAVVKASVEGHRALERGEAQQAATIFSKLLEQVPDAPEFRNNLAGAYGLLRRKREALDLLRENFERHPDYFFSRVGMARVYLEQGRTDEAEAVLAPLLSIRRMHATEFSGLCGVHVDISLARRQRRQARLWLSALEDKFPDHPQIASFRDRVARLT